MADQKISQLTAKGTAIASTDLIEISESNGAGGYVTKSITGANVVNGLQPTLVSGTNIKSINSTTILGSGDLALQPTLVSGTDIKTINGTTLLGSGDLLISSGVHILTKPVSGRLYNVRTTGVAVNTFSSTTANSISLYPFIPANSITISNLQMTIGSALFGGFIRILVYSDLNGVPSSKLIESTSLDCSTTGIKTYTTSFTFTAGTTYWLGYYSNLSVQPNTFDAAQMTPISGSTYTTSFTSVTVAATFPTAPSTLGTATLSTATPNFGIINLQAT
jgi:uncharacterized membrane protein YgdD (TMEM256/DUF423 family)